MIDMTFFKTAINAYKVHKTFLLNMLGMKINDFFYKNLTLIHIESFLPNLIDNQLFDDLMIY